MKNDPIELALARLDEVPLHSAEGQTQIANALNSKWNLVAAKAARITGEARRTELIDQLVSAFDRLIRRGAEADKGCAAMTEIVRALFDLDYRDEDLYLKGIRHVQMEPVWGGSVDTAVDLRAVCAMGLAHTSYPAKLPELADLLADKEWRARAGAARALAAVGSEAALVLLRFKALTGDQEADVLSDCFEGLLSAGGAEYTLFVGSFLKSMRAEEREAAILSLGASRRADAVELLQEKFNQAAASEMRKLILLSLAVSRTDAAIAFLLDLIRRGSAEYSEAAVRAMDVNAGDPSLRDQVERALRERRD